LRITENGVLRGISGSKGEEVTGAWKNCIMGRFII
jgi:hypothetical protein